KSPSSLILVALDNFEAVHESAGYPAGAVLLRAVTDEIVRSIRSEDVVTRYAANELAIIVPAASRTEVFRIAEHVRSRVAALRVTVGDQPLSVTATIGSAELDECRADATAHELVALAERRLARAKIEGRNRVCAD